MHASGHFEKALFSYVKPGPDVNSVRGFPCSPKTKLFISSSETQHGRRLIKVYHGNKRGSSLVINKGLLFQFCFSNVVL